jgi:pimeloyl-ACP methyl ester carboxylesterase
MFRNVDTIKFSRLAFILALCAGCIASAQKPAHTETQRGAKDDQVACHELMGTPNLTILSAEAVPAARSLPAYCQVYGLIAPAIHWQAQLPLGGAWNGRLLNIGNGGKAGNFQFAYNRLAAGYAVVSNNTGHDNGAEPNSTFAFNNKQEFFDYAYRAIHVTANASKTLVQAFYGKPQKFAYFEGCSTGGRQGMLEAQRFPADFDGIVIGSPAIDFTRLNIAHIWTEKHLLENKSAGNLAFDVDGDGSFKSLKKLNILRDAVLAKCDAKDGVKDGVVDDPRACDFKPAADLKAYACPNDKNGDGCFTQAQLKTIEAIYAGPHDSKGKQIFFGPSFGSEVQWPLNVIPWGGNHFLPTNLAYEIDHANFLIYEDSPGLTADNIQDLSYKPDKHGVFPEYAWWEFNFDDATNGKAAFVERYMDAVDPDLSRYLKNKKGKLLIYQGWSDGDALPESIVHYYQDMVKTTFDGSYEEAQKDARLFMMPGMGHCGGGPGPNEWDKLPVLARWVEDRQAPDSITAVHRSNVRDEAHPGSVTNERKLCPFPQHAVYTGPAGGQDEQANWKEQNFSCRLK